jgi:hypothetical protein
VGGTWYVSYCSRPTSRKAPVRQQSYSKHWSVITTHGLRTDRSHQLLVVLGSQVFFNTCTHGCSVRGTACSVGCALWACIALAMLDSPLALHGVSHPAHVGGCVQADTCHAPCSSTMHTCTGQPGARVDLEAACTLKVALMMSPPCPMVMSSRCTSNRDVHLQ